MELRPSIEQRNYLTQDTEWDNRDLITQEENIFCNSTYMTSVQVLDIIVRE